MERKVKQQCGKFHFLSHQIHDEAEFFKKVQRLNAFSLPLNESYGSALHSMDKKKN